MQINHEKDKIRIRIKYQRMLKAYIVSRQKKLSQLELSMKIVQHRQVVIDLNDKEVKNKRVLKAIDEQVAATLAVIK